MSNWSYNVIKTRFVDVTGLTNDLLHVYCGVSIQLAICVALGLRLRSATPLYFVCVFEMFNEIFDILAAHGSIDSEFVNEVMRDFGNTVAIPTILFLVARFSRLFNE
jgi:hypothetical protein